MDKEKYDALYTDVVKTRIEGIYVFDENLRFDKVKGVAAEVEKDILESKAFMSKV